MKHDKAELPDGTEWSVLGDKGAVNLLVFRYAAAICGGSSIPPVTLGIHGKRKFPGGHEQGKCDLLLPERSCWLQELTGAALTLWEYSHRDDSIIWRGLERHYAFAFGRDD